MLSNEELISVRGGGITASLFSSLSRFIETIYNIGQSVGSSIRRAITGRSCKIR